MTSFARKVYNVVLNIPLGQVRTYKWVAKKAGRPGAYRAVGTILRKNPYPIIIPCHRIVKSDKELGSYSFGGTRRKKLFLAWEKEIKKWLANRE